MKRYMLHKVRVAFFCLLTVTAATFSYSADKDIEMKGGASSENAFARALQFAEAKDWGKSIILLKDLHAKHPGNRQISNNLAVAYFYQGRIDKAQELLAEVLESSRETRTSFKNIQMLYGYVTAEAYRQGLGTQKKSKLPTLYLNRFLDGSSQELLQTVSSPVVASKAPATKILEPQQRIHQKTTVSGSEDNLIQVQQKLVQWAAAWSAGDAVGYISFYLPEYSPSKRSRKSWLRDRMRKVRPSREINVELVIKDVFYSPDSKQISTLFMQRYTAKNYQDVVTKKITWTQRNGKWLISAERVVQ